MLGLRLRYQIAGFIFILFTTVVLFMGYFNVTILSDQLQRLSLYRANSSARNLFGLFQESMNSGHENLESFISDRTRLNQFLKYTMSSKELRNVGLYDVRGAQLYSRFKNQDVSLDVRSVVHRVVATQKERAVVWAVDPYNGKGEQIEKYGLLDPRLIIADFYFPILKNADVVGVFRVTLNLEKASRLLKFFFMGNLSLSMVFILTAFVAIYMWSENAINKPIRNLLRAQEQLSRGNFDVHVDLNLPRNNELAVIADSFNKMARELNTYQQQLKEQTTQLEKLNRQYLGLNENLEHQVEEKTLELREFFSLITHDLKIPLAAIKGYLALLQKTKTGPLNDKQKKFVTSIEAATGHLLGMVKNLLDSVKYDAGKVEYFMEDFTLQDLLDEVTRNLHPLVGEKGIDLTVMIPDECCPVMADRTKIGQVLSNILSNAINYTPDGGNITVTAEEEGETVEVRIRDSGIGIPPDLLERIFEKFQQIPGKESPSTSLGLGLYIVRKIMEGHGMRVWAKSTQGKGSSFYFTLKKSTSEGCDEKDEQKNEKD